MSHLLFNWVAPTTHEDGSAISTTLTYNLYEDTVKIVPNIGALSFSLLMDGKSYKSYSYYLTAVDSSTGLESKPSPTVTAAFIPPKPPTGFSYSFTA